MIAKISALVLAITVSVTPLTYEVKEVKNELEYKGVFSCTAYCGCTYCCGNSCGLTYSGTTPQEGKTIGVDKSVIPMGTEVYIEGLGYYTAEDTGSAVIGNVIDVYFDSHEDALEFGRQNHDVYIVKTTD